MATDTDTDTEHESTPEPSSTPEKPTPKPLKNSIVTLTAQKISAQQGRNPPVAGYFPSGFGLTSTKANNQSGNPSISLFRNEKKVKRVELVVKPNDNNSSGVDYVATNYSGEAAAGKIGGFGLLVVDKDAHKMKFLPLASSRVLRLEPKVRRADMSDKEPETPSKAELTAVEKMQKNNELLERFGTTIARKQAKKAQRLRQKEDPEAEQELNQILEETPIDRAAVDSTTIDANLNVPPHNLTATTVEGAYPLEKIIPQGEWDYLNDIVDLLQAGKEINSDAYPSFVCNRSHKVELVKDEEEKRHVAGILSYITHLIHFKNRHMLDGPKSAKKHNIPSMLYQKFSRMFLDGSKNRVADNKIAVLISYVLVLTLHIDEFESDFTDIAGDLRMTAVDVRPYLENLGCKFKRRNNVLVATLPVPLQFPTVRKRRRRG